MGAIYKGPFEGIAGTSSYLAGSKAYHCGSLDRTLLYVPSSTATDWRLTTNPAMRYVWTSEHEQQTKRKRLSRTKHGP